MSNNPILTDDVRQFGELVKAMMFDADALREPGYTLYRANDSSDGRWYYSPERETYYPSVTTVIGATSPTPYGILKWYMDEGRFALRLLELTANYGTLFHTVAADFMISKEVRIGELHSLAMTAMQENQITEAERNHHKVGDWSKKLIKAVLSLNQWVIDKNVEPLAVEIVLASEKGWAGAVDLICRYDRTVEYLDHENPFKSGPRKGEPRPAKKDVRAVGVWDYKTGKIRKGHAVQAHMYLQMVQENFPDLDCETCNNWSPNDWRKSPTYDTMDQTDDPLAPGLIPTLKAQFDVRSPEPSARFVPDGTKTIKFGEPVDEAFAHMNIGDELK